MADCTAGVVGITYTHGETNEIREIFLDALKQEGFRSEDLEEIVLNTKGVHIIKPERISTISRTTVRVCAQDYWDHKIPHDHIIKQLRPMYDMAKLLIIIGVSHAFGYAMYGLPGKVVRYDAHGDVVDGYGIANRIGRAEYNHINFTNYVYRAVEYKLKAKAKICNHGISPFIGLSGRFLGAKHEEPCRNAEIFDIDVDVLHRDYGIRCFNDQGFIKEHQLYEQVQLSRPKVIGIFEYSMDNDRYGEGKRILAKLVVDAARLRFNNTKADSIAQS